MAKTSLYGLCSLCGERVAKGGMTRHLKSCAPKHDEEKGKSERLYHLRVEGRYAPEYWLDLEIKAKEPLGKLDSFLRRTWLECCGHMSGFRIKGNLDRFADSLDDGLMDVKLEDALEPGTTFEYDYDYGSTTRLKLKVINERQGRIGKDALRLLGRNEAPEFTCTVCNEEAAWLHTEEIYDSENPFYCQKHMKTHEDRDYFLPVVNSPRMGVCAYSG